MSDRTRFTINRPDVIDEVFDGEYVVVNLKNGSYYALSAVSALIWEQLKQGASRAEIVTQLAQHFSGEPAMIEHATQNFLNELEQETLITPQPNSSSNSLPIPTLALSTTNAPFTPPILEKFTDMRQVLLLDPIHEVDDSGWPARKV